MTLVDNNEDGEDPELKKTEAEALKIIESQDNKQWAKINGTTTIRILRSIIKNSKGSCTSFLHSRLFSIEQGKERSHQPTKIMCDSMAITCVFSPLVQGILLP
jgi:hypothetical protein